MHRLVIAAPGLMIFAFGCNTTNLHPQTNVMYDNYAIRPAIPPPRKIVPPGRYVPPPPIHRKSHTWYPQYRQISGRWKTIVLHHSATHRGGAKLFDKHHRHRGWDELGYHFVIGNGTDTPDGSIEMGSRWHHQKHGAHCKTRNNFYNDHGIGICLVGDFTKQPPTRKQLESLYKLTRFLCDTCIISSSRIISHNVINQKTKCPGRYFPVDMVRRSIASTSTTLRRPVSAIRIN